MVYNDLRTFSIDIDFLIALTIIG